MRGDQCNGKSGSTSFLRWPGGKRWLSKQITEIILSIKHTRYVEPFLGGGAVFFNYSPHNAALSDNNRDLILTYKIIQNNPNELINILKGLPTGKADFYKMREMHYPDEVMQAARFLYLNRLSFNGMYRVNQSGQFNVPYGGDRKIDILWDKNLIINASKSLQGVEVRCCDFDSVLASCGKGDVVYCDPTYTTRHSGDSFLRYNEKIFQWSDQERLARSCFNAVERGACVIVSNAANKLIKDLYSPFIPKVLSRYTGVSCKKSGRKMVDEFLFVLQKA
jgi:DNA adenine methylase